MTFRDSPVESLQGTTMDHWRNYTPRERLNMGLLLVSNAVTSAGNTISDDEARAIVSDVVSFTDGLVRQYGVGER